MQERKACGAQRSSEHPVQIRFHHDDSHGMKGRCARDTSRNGFVQDSPTLDSAECIDRISGEIDEEEAVIAETF